MYHCLKYFIIVTGLVWSFGASGADVKINGFASIVGGKTISREPLLGGEESVVYADFANNGLYDSQLTFYPDSNMALQFIVDMEEGLTATAQINAVGSTQFDAEIAWAFISWKANSEFTFQAGRQRIPLYYFSDSLEVAYSYHWIRGPIEIYNASMANYTGVKLIYETIVSDVPVRFQWYGGESSGFNFVSNAAQAYKDLMGITLDADHKGLAFRATYGQAKYGLEGATSTLNGITLDQGLDNGVDISLGNVALRLDRLAYFVMAEYSNYSFGDPQWTDIGGFGVKRGDGWYVSSGIRIGAYTPHITYGALRFLLDSSAAIFLGLASEDQTLKTRAITVGLRWDFHPSAAFKFEYYDSKDKSDDLVLLGGETFTVTAVSMGIDVVF
ncbi:MAG: hypothetical protein JKY67_04890 [Pseudomonadales bacterium]|nr:hypothetical protein [Pseudomonadales bacterium]